MLIVLFILGIGLSVFTLLTDYEEWTIAPILFEAVVCIVALALACTFPYHIDERIAMYEEENTKIETKIKATVQSYMQYEGDTYKNLIENAELTTLLIKYPELNSNELVKSEIENYKDNSKEIKELKNKRFYKSAMAWWLYFGK